MSGVSNRFRPTLPRTPAVFEGKAAWKKYKALEEFNHWKVQSKKTHVKIEQLKEQQAMEFEQDRTIALTVETSRKEWNSRLRRTQLTLLEKPDASVRINN